MIVNESNLDRAIRGVLGIAMMVLGGSGGIGVGAGVAGVIAGAWLFVTAVTGCCLVYRWLHWSTASHHQGPHAA